MLTLAAFLLGVSSASEAQNPPPSCKPRGSRTITVNEAVRVYQIKRRTPEGDATSVYACRPGRRGGVRVRMASSIDNGYYDEGSGVSHVRLVGRFVAFCVSTFSSARSKYEPDAPNISDKVGTIDMSARRPRRRLHTPIAELGYSIVDLEANRRGAVGWLVERTVFDAPGHGGGAERPPSYRVGVADAGGMRTLDAGGDIAPGSLGIARSFAYWTRGGRPQSAPLR